MVHGQTPGPLAFLYPGGCLPRGVVSALGGVSPGGCLPRGVVSCDLSHHAFDVSCMVPPHQLRLNISAAAYIVLTHCMLGYPSVNRMTDRQV